MSRYRTLDEVDVSGRRILVRADLNVPVENGQVTDKTRIERTLVTVRELTGKGARVILLSHFGRPKGVRVPEMSLKPVADALTGLLGKQVAFAEDCVGEAAKAAVNSLEDGDVLLLENTRFHKGEEENDPALARAFAELGDLYVNDGFSVSHRAHASTEGVAHLLPSVAGRAMEAELNALTRALTDPQHPIVAVVGGAKVSTKLDVLDNLIGRVDRLVIGGAMANTFLFAMGKNVGKSLCERDLAETAARIVTKSKERMCAIILPTDVVIAAGLDENAEPRTVSVENVPGDMMILDVGPNSLAELAREFESARTVLWNGPLGAFEVPPFDNGTNVAARHVAMLTKSKGTLSVAGGGDTVAALRHAGVLEGFSYVSTAGGAFLEWLEGKELPGVKALMRD